MTYKWLTRNFKFSILVFALILSFFSLNFISATGSVIYDDPSVPHVTTSASTGTININNSFTNITNVYTSINQTNNYTNNESLWNISTNLAGQVTLHPRNLTPNIGIGTNESDYDLEVRNSDGQDTTIAISSGVANANATLMFREADVVRYKIFYDSLLAMFQIYSFALDKSVLSFNLNGDAEFSQDVNILGNITARGHTNLTTLNVSNQANFGGNVSIAHKLSTKSLYVTNNIYSNGNFYAFGNVSLTNTKGANATLNNFIEHTQEMMTDTLLDKSSSRLSVSGGVLNYTLIAFYGCGQFNFDGTLYPITGSPCVSNATISLVSGTDIVPVTNYIYWELVAGVPTMKTASTYPTNDHIDVATFVVGSVTGTTANIYSYNRNRYEVDTFVKRVIQRFEESGTLYVSGFNPAVNRTQINITSGGEFFNGIFEMTSTNTIKSNEGFYYINGTGNFVQATSLSSFTQYADGTAFALGNERVNIVWGLVPVNVTGGVGPTQMRLVAVIPNKPGVVYNTIAEAITDNYDTTNYFPPNSEIKNVFVPIARTILRPSTDLFEPFSTGNYYQDIRGKITSGGGSAAATPTYWSLSGNTLGTTTGTYQVKVNELLINNTNYLYNAISAYGNINSYYQFNVWNKNMSSLASSDLVATSPIGSESSYFVDVGITGPTYNDPVYGPATPANTSFLIATNTSLNIGTGSSGKIISFFVDSFTVPLWIMNMTSTSINVFKPINMTGNNITNINIASMDRVKLIANTTTAICGTADAGNIYYNGGIKKHYGCNSTDWNALY